MKNNECQIHCLPQMCAELNPAEILWQRRNRVKRRLKRRWKYLINLLSNANNVASAEQEKARSGSKASIMQSGDLVRVKSKREIRATLDNWNMLRGCGFMQEMEPYCDTTQRVFKRVERFLDERDYLMKKCKGMVTLDGVLCGGTIDFGACDRGCFFFWREEWLEKLE